MYAVYEFSKGSTKEFRQRMSSYSNSWSNFVDIENWRFLSWKCLKRTIMRVTFLCKHPTVVYLVILLRAQNLRCCFCYHSRTHIIWRCSPFKTQNNLPHCYWISYQWRFISQVSILQHLQSVLNLRRLPRLAYFAHTLQDTECKGLSLYQVGSLSYFVPPITSNLKLKRLALFCIDWFYNEQTLFQFFTTTYYSG